MCIRDIHVAAHRLHGLDLHGRASAEGAALIAGEAVVDVDVVAVSYTHLRHPHCRGDRCERGYHAQRTKDRRADVAQLSDGIGHPDRHGQDGDPGDPGGRNMA